MSQEPTEVRIPLAATDPVSRETESHDETPIAAAAEAAARIRGGRTAPWPRPSSTRVLTVANQKGGVGKTTTTVNLAASLALHGLCVVVIDLDPQGNASTALAVPHHSGERSIYEVLVDGEPLASAVHEVEAVPGLACVPATIDLAGAEIELVSLVARESRLQRALTAWLKERADAGERIDYVLIDCPPSLGMLTLNMLTAADAVIIPIQCEYYALEGLSQLLNTVRLVQRSFNPKLAIDGVLLTMFDARLNLSRQVADDDKEYFGARMFRTAIPRNVRLAEAPSFGKPILMYDIGSAGAQTYLAVAEELIHRTTSRTRISDPEAQFIPSIQVRS
jgi:chromosome partitioning protein